MSDEIQVVQIRMPVEAYHEVQRVAALAEVTPEAVFKVALATWLVRNDILRQRHDQSATGDA